MRRQLITTVAAVTSMVLLAFLIPLGYLVALTTEDRAVRGAILELDTLRSVVGTQTPEAIGLAVDFLNSQRIRRTTVRLGDGTVLGMEKPASPAERLARARGSTVDAEAVEGGREIAAPVEGRPEGLAVISVVITADQLRQGVLRAWGILGALGLGLFVLAIVVADRLARHIVGPTVELAAAAAQLEAGNLETRVTPGGPPETTEVGHALNRLAARIGELLSREREAVADLSHRLRTPVAALRLDAEGLTDADERARLTDDVDALERMVDDVIHEARRPVREGAGGGCEAVSVVRERVEFWRVLAEDQDRRLQVRLPEERAQVAVSAQDLAAAVDVMLGNVFSHTEEGVPFRVTVEVGSGCVAVIVSDSGTGFPGSEVLQRGRSGGGSTGLGLDIARRTAEASGGRLLIARSGSGGAEITLELGTVPAH